MRRDAALAAVATALAAALWFAAGAAAEELENDAVYIPTPGAASLAVRNPLGTVRLRGWDQPQLRIIAAKRAGSAAMLARLKVRVDLVDGRVRVTTGFYLNDASFNSLPLAGSAIDLTIDAPRAVALSAATFTGEIEAEGFRAGAQLSSQEGEIRVADVDGAVDTRSLDGRQAFQSIRGSLVANGVVGDMELASIDGESVEATVYKGRIVARDLRTAVVRLRSTHGTIVYVGALRPDGRYELATHDGDVHLQLRPAPFQVTMRAPSVKSGFALVGGASGPGLWSGEYRVASAETTASPSLELVSAAGEVVLAPYR
jgi:hypothetical protein